MKKIIIALVLFTGMVQAQVQVNYQQNLSHFSNPERGLYYRISTKPDDFSGPYRSLANTYAQGDLEDALDRKFSLIHFIIRLDQFIATDAIPQAFLDSLNLDFGRLRARGLKCVLRFSYSNYGTLTSSQVYEPTIDRLLGVPRSAPTSAMPGHINQLKAVTLLNEDVISSMEAGFIGNYGEWYNSKTTTPNLSDFGLGNPTTLDSQVPTTYRNNRTEVATAIMAMTLNRMVAFRTPYFQKLLAPTLPSPKVYPRYSNTTFARVAAHNDALFYNLYDEGTYRDQGDSGASDRSYLATKSKTTFTGGESNDDNTTFNSCTSNANSLSMTSLDQMEAYHYNYLNYSFYEAIMDPDTGHWAGTTLSSGSTCLDEVKRRLGYRFRLLDSTINPTNHSITIHLTNEGYANVFNPRDVNLVLKSGSATYRFNMQGPVDTNNILAPGYSTNVRVWYAGTNITLSRSLTSMIPIGGSTVIPNGTYDVYLELPDATITTNRDLYSIRFANANTFTKVVGGVTTSLSGTFWDSTNGFNNLFQSITITAGTGSKMASNNDISFDVISSPNPFNASFKLNISTSSEEIIAVKVFDMLGKLVENRTVTTNELESLEIGSKLSSGIYNVIVKQGENEKTVRVIKN